MRASQLIRVFGGLDERDAGAEQLVGPERRERVSHQTWCGEGCVDTHRPVNSTFGFFLGPPNARIANCNSVGVNGHDHVRYRNLGSFDIGYSSKIEDQSESVCFLFTIPRG